MSPESENTTSVAAPPPTTSPSTTPAVATNTSTTNTTAPPSVFAIEDFPVIPDCVEEYPALQVPAQRTAELRRRLSHLLLQRPRTPNVYKCKEADNQNYNKRIIVLANEQALQDQAVQSLLTDSSTSSIEENGVSATSWTLHKTYLDLTTDEILRKILPTTKDDSEMEIPTAFESVGPLAHVNLRSDLLPYKYWIGKVLLEKNQPNIKTVVNKVGTIESEYRTFGMEVIAGYQGEGWSLVTAKEEGSVFQFDFTKVYWNSRLAGEHRRIVNSIRKEQAKLKRRLVVADLMAGVGPFAVPLTRKQPHNKKQHDITVYANDLNPDSYKYLVSNAEKNKCQNLHCYNMDAREFVHKCLGTIAADVVIMNLPATAPEFLDAFRGYRNAARDGDDNDPTASALPLVHVHCFAPKQSESSGYPDAVERCAKALGCDLDKNSVDVRTVRNVAPNKNMVCVSFRLPEAIGDVPALSSKDDIPTIAGGASTGSSELPESKRLKTC